MKVYKMIFQVTETCNNGKERTKKVEVLSPCIIRRGNHRVNHTEGIRVGKAMDELAKKHYYNVKYIGTKSTVIVITDDLIKEV